MATFSTICCRYSSGCMGASNCATSVLLSMPERTPTSMGVPTAPKDTGVDWMTSTAITAAMAGKPRASSRGAPTAEGVPKPDEPSISEPNSHATMMTCTRRSGETSMKPWRMGSSAPLSLRVLSSNTAPKTINSKVMAVTTPLMVAAAITAPGACHTNSANSAVTK